MKIVFENPWLSIEERIFAEPPSNGQEPYYLIHGCDGVYILAITTEGSVVVVKQFRPTVNRAVLELPAGGIDAGESPLESAKRELFEETGYVSDDWHALGAGQVALERFCPKIFSFVALGATKDPQHIPEEGVEVELLSPNELSRAAKSGEFFQIAMLGTITLAALNGFIPFYGNSR